jgi:hypothetical protein
MSIDLLIQLQRLVTFFLNKTKQNQAIITGITWELRKSSVAWPVTKKLHEFTGGQFADTMEHIISCLLVDV